MLPLLLALPWAVLAASTSNETATWKLPVAPGQPLRVPMSFGDRTAMVLLTSGYDAVQWPCELGPATEGRVCIGHADTAHCFAVNAVDTSRCFDAARVSVMALAALESDQTAVLLTHDSLTFVAAAPQQLNAARLVPRDPAISITPFVFPASYLRVCHWNFVQHSVAVSVDITSECLQVPMAVFELFRQMVPGESPTATQLRALPGPLEFSLASDFSPVGGVRFDVRLMATTCVVPSAGNADGSGVFVLGRALLRSHDVVFAGHQRWIAFSRALSVPYECEPARSGVCNVDPTDGFRCIDDCGYYFWQRFDEDTKRCVMRLDVAIGVCVAVAVAVLGETALAFADWRLLRSIPPRNA